jgi:hypothetical protein
MIGPRVNTQRTIPSLGAACHGQTLTRWLVTVPVLDCSEQVIESKTRLGALRQRVEEQRRQRSTIDDTAPNINS